MTSARLPNVRRLGSALRAVRQRTGAAAAELYVKAGNTRRIEVVPWRPPAPTDPDDLNVQVSVMDERGWALRAGGGGKALFLADSGLLPEPNGWKRLNRHSLRPGALRLPAPGAGKAARSGALKPPRAAGKAARSGALGRPPRGAGTARPPDRDASRGAAEDGEAAGLAFLHDVLRHLGERLPEARLIRASLDSGASASALASTTGAARPNRPAAGHARNGVRGFPERPRGPLPALPGGARPRLAERRRHRRRSRGTPGAGDGGPAALSAGRRGRRVSRARMQPAGPARARAARARRLEAVAGTGRGPPSRPAPTADRGRRRPRRRLDERGGRRRGHPDPGRVAGPRRRARRTAAGLGGRRLVGLQGSRLPPAIGMAGLARAVPLPPLHCGRRRTRPVDAERHRPRLLPAGPGARRTLPGDVRCRGRRRRGAGSRSTRSARSFAAASSWERRPG